MKPYQKIAIRECRQSLIPIASRLV